MHKQDQNSGKYSTPIMVSGFVCALLGFHAREFPAKTEKSWEYIVDRRSYFGSDPPGSSPSKYIREYLGNYPIFTK